MMRVLPVPGEMLRYRVQSEARPMLFYLVELDAHFNNGQCDCAQFIMRCGPMLDERWASARWHRCKHIQAARDFFCDEMLKRITDERKRIRNEEKS